MADDLKEIAISDLPIDTPLPGDLLTPAGQVIVKQGRTLEQNLVDLWIQSGFVKVLMRTGAAEPYEQPLDEALIQSVSQSSSLASKAVASAAKSLASSSEVDLGVLQSIFARLLSAVRTDSDSVIWSLEADFANDQLSADDALAFRSVALGTLAATTAVSLGLSAAECADIAMAGVLHDISLYTESRNLLRAKQGIVDATAIMRQHSLLGVELVAACPVINQPSRVAMTQVHEQVDGSGYPRGLTAEHLTSAGKILNLVDAYLTMTDVLGPTKIMRADTIAYLVSQTSLGRFDPECMRAFLKATSMYGIGTKVMLDNYTTGRVIRSSVTDPVRPIVRLDDAQGKIIDLRRSNRSIDAPLEDDRRRRRLTKSELSGILWM